MQEWVVDQAGAGMRLDQWLALRTDARSRSRASEWIQRGKVYLAGEPVDATQGGMRLLEGDRVGVWIDRPGSSKPADLSVLDARHLLAIAYEDAAIVVVDKPAGLIVEPLPGRPRDESTLLDLLRDHYRHMPRTALHVVHRIDRDTTGLVLFARSPAARDALKEQFEERTPDRVYQAVVLGKPVPARGTWKDKLAWDALSLRQRRAHGTDARAKDAISHYKVVEQFAEAALLEVSLTTGKRNQIRVQTAFRGHPLIGERQYRFEAPAEPAGMPTLDRQALHACRLGFVHPGTGKRVEFTSSMPDDMTELVEQLRRR